MADEMPRADEVTNLTPEEVAAGLRELLHQPPVRAS